MTPKLPAWPKYEPRNGRSDIYAAAIYETARYQACLARLRVAVEALRAVQAESRSKDALWFEAAYDKIADAALSTIGEVPEL